MPLSKKAYKLLLSARDHLRASEICYNNGVFDCSAFYAELCAQKCVKGIIRALGFEPGKTHTPSRVLSELIRISPEVREKLKNGRLAEIITRIINLSMILEQQGVITRYGEEREDEIIIPSEIYDATNTRELLDKAKEVLRITEEIIGELDC